MVFRLELGGDSPAYISEFIACPMHDGRLLFEGGAVLKLVLV
jgi:hypothetical protein